MINIKVIDIKKHYKWIYIILTCAMFFIAFQVIGIDFNGVYVQAKGMGESDNLVTVSPGNNNRNKLLVLILNKAIPAMEVNYILEHGDESYSRLYKLALGKVISFDYQDPRSLLRAQIPVLGEVNDDLSEEPYEFAMEEQEPEREDREIFFVDKTPAEDSTRNDGVREDLPASKITEPSVDKSPNTDIAVVSSPIKMPNKVEISATKPSILIYHTHGTESYLPETVGNFHSLNEEFTVRAVGEQMTKLLTNKGFKVVHDKTLHDYPSYNQSYIRGSETLNKNLEENSSLKIILDIHRDAAVGENAKKNSYITINNEKVARFAIVVGTANKNADELMTFAEYFKAKSDELYPGLAKKTITKEFKYNQYHSDYYALVEVGNTANHIDEAIRTSYYLTEILESVINDIKK